MTNANLETVPPKGLLSRRASQQVCTNATRAADSPVPGSRATKSRVTKHPVQDAQLSGRTRTRVKSSKLSRTMSLRIMAREYVWLWDYRHGVCANAIAIRDGVTVQRVEFGLARALAQENVSTSGTADRPPRLVPLFPIGAYTPQSGCGHKRPIATGSVLCCMVCHCSGLDHHPALQRDPASEPPPESKSTPAPKEPARETRKQRRQRLFGARADAEA
jgi:hypothetical protein